jgi:CubicO group peptidase (beta-lactamase class C family)
MGVARLAAIVTLLVASCTSSTVEPTAVSPVTPSREASASTPVLASATPTPAPATTSAAEATTTPSPAQTTPTPAQCGDLIPESTANAVRSYVDGGLNVGIVLGVVSPCGRDVLAYGSSALAGGRPLDQDTVFEIGSTGKSFTGILLADMVQGNELALSDPIEEYLPADVTAPTYEGRSITLVDLATHTSGLPSLPENFNPADELRPYADYSFDQMYAALGNTQLATAPGSQYEYSNFGFGVLGHVLELRTGMSY